MPKQKQLHSKRRVTHAITCTACGNIISDEVFRARKTAPKEHNFCDQACVHAWQRATGHFTAMSQKGKEARRSAVKESNREHPRRAKKERER